MVLIIVTLYILLIVVIIYTVLIIVILYILLIMVIINVMLIIVIFYSVVDGNDVSLNDNYFYRVNVYANGVVVWSPFFNWVTSCDIDALYFPFDSQRCRVQFINWMYTIKLINFTVLPNTSVDTSICKMSSDWIITSTSVESTITKKAYPLIWFELALQRVPTYFVFNIIVPTICLSLLSTFVFLLPAESGEKMGLSITTLMSFSVILLILSDVIPKNSRPPVMRKKHINSKRIISDVY